MRFHQITALMVAATIAFFLFSYPLRTAEADVASEQSYKIQEGETLWSLADKFYGDGFKWSYIATRNNIKNPEDVAKDKILFIPPLSSQYAKKTDTGVVFAGPSPKPNPNANVAQGKTSDVLGATVSLEEAVYADLAIRHYLNNVSVFSSGQKPEDSIAISADRQWLPASTVKTFVAMFAFDQVDKGNLSLEDQVQVQAKNVVPTELVTDDLPAIQEGEFITIDRLIRQMITQSDNTAYNVLLDVLDRRSVTDYIHSLGLRNSAVGSKLNLDDVQQGYEVSVPGYGINTTTAQDFAKSFEIINKGGIPGSSDLLSILSQQRINNMIPLYLPKSVKVAHKTGDLDPLYHDGGIITTSNRNYVLSIFSNAGDPKLVAHISDLIYTKNLNLVGVNESQTNNSVSEAGPEQALDPLVARGEVQSQVLGVSTAPSPAITAADLGIKASDLSSGISSQNLPKVLIPADSRFHFLVNAFSVLRKATVFVIPGGRAQADLSDMRLRIAEANDLKNRGKVDQANTILQETQIRMITLAKRGDIQRDAPSQAALQGLSDTRFTVLSEELKSVNTAQDRTKLIKEIAREAKQTVKEVQPFIPQAGNAVSPDQKAIVGEVISVDSTSIKIKTAGGQELEIPNQSVKIKGDKTIPASPSSLSSGSPLTSTVISTSSLSSLKKGSTIALVGTVRGNTFIPSIVVKNVPKELLAPQPVIVLKVDTKKKTMVVSENGIPVQVNLTNQAVIRGADTNVSLSSIKAGDVVVVHPEAKDESFPTKTGTSGSPFSSVSPTVNSQSSKFGTSSRPGQQLFPQQIIPSKLSTPNVINSSSIRIIERKQDVGASIPSASSKPSVSQPATPKTQKASATKQEERKETKTDSKK